MCLERVCLGNREIFFGYRKFVSYVRYIEQLLIYQLLGLDCNMSVKLHYLYSYLDCIPENLGDLVEEQEEPIHHIRTKE